MIRNIINVSVPGNSGIIRQIVHSPLSSAIKGANIDRWKFPCKNKNDMGKGSSFRVKTICRVATGACLNILYPAVGSEWSRPGIRIKMHHAGDDFSPVWAANFWFRYKTTLSFPAHEKVQKEKLWKEVHSMWGISPIP